MEDPTQPGMLEDPMQPGMLRCSKCDKEGPTGCCMCCKTVRYGGRECQRAAWAAHELVCKDAECKKDEPVPAAAEDTGARCLRN